jgi:uncharacterized protein YjiS (DUF1127 family)
VLDRPTRARAVQARDSGGDERREHAGRREVNLKLVPLEPDRLCGHRPGPAERENAPPSSGVTELPRCAEDVESRSKVERASEENLHGAAYHGERRTFPGMTPAGLCCGGMDPDTPAPRVSFTVDDDDHARSIEDVLGALGFDAVRSMDSTNALHWGIIRLVRKYKITERERLVLELMLTEQLDDEGIARRIATGSGPVTVAFLRSQILAKTCAPDREQLLRLALQLPARAV